MIENRHFNRIAEQLGLQTRQVEQVVQLLDDDCTIPFIARYRKEQTGSLDEVCISSIRDLYKHYIEIEKRRQQIKDTLIEQGNLTADLEQRLSAAETLCELEDLYLPFKPKRRTKAMMAREKGLEPLAKKLMKQYPMEVLAEAKPFVNTAKGVNSVEDALQGARDIIAEWVSERVEVRNRLRNLFVRESRIYSLVVKGKEEEGKNYAAYFDMQELCSKAPSHRVLAMFRGEKEGVLRLTVAPDANKAIESIQRRVCRGNSQATLQVAMAVEDSYKRLLQPQMETEMRQEAKQRADRDAIAIFADNLRHLLLAAPLGQKTVLAIDPGFRTGCKVVVLDKQGNLLTHDVFYIVPPEQNKQQAAALLQQLVNKYKVEAIAIGNGTAGRETELFVRSLTLSGTPIVVSVNESGASVYSASETAREEFPDYDITVRGAVSIGRRLIDPLAELVKIDPQSIGVGQYQHDVNQAALRQSLTETVESCVNLVGVQLNTAGKELLSYVSGIGATLAKNIVEYRKQHGAFRSRKELLNVPRFGAKAFEQAAGFLRIEHAENPLDNTAVHPENYAVVERMAKHLHVETKALIKNTELLKQLNLQTFVSEGVGLTTLTDIVHELAKPNRDPRETFEVVAFDPSVRDIADLRVGMVLNGIVTNVTAFGCFVDIGLHEQGLVHKSRLANTFVRDPNEVVRVQQHIKVKVVEVDYVRRKIGLSAKDV